MKKEERLKALEQKLKESPQPLPGDKLAKSLHVSRQVIVQDIALLRALNMPIISTNRGYILPNQEYSMVVKVNHSMEQMQQELETIVDCGATVHDVFVEHATYGKLEAKLSLSSRRDVKEFLNQIQQGKSQPLNNLTQGIHYHTITARSQDILDEVKKSLDKMGILC